MIGEGNGVGAPVGGDGGGGGNQPSIEQLRAAQEQSDRVSRAHAEALEMNEQMRQEEEQKIARAIAMRDQAHKEIQGINAAIQEQGGKELASHIDKNEEYSLELRDKEAALKNLRETFENAENRLKGILEIVRGKDNDQIAEVVSAELEKAENQRDELAEQIKKAEEEAEIIKSRFVPEETAENFRNLLEQANSLSEKITKLENMKAVRDKLFDEALTENAARERIVAILVDKVRRGYIPSEIQQLYITNLTNIYLSNELRGLSDGDRAKALNGIACTIRNADPTVIDTTKILREHLANKELLPYYDMANTLIMFSGIYESYLNSPRMLGVLKNRAGGSLQYDSRYVHEMERIAKEELAKHADTYNYVLAASRATEDYGLLFQSSQVLSEVRDGSYGIVLSDESPFVPSNITEQEARDIGKAYRKYFLMMAYGVLGIIEKTLNTHKALLEQLTSELNELQARLKRIDELKERYESQYSKNEGRNRHEEETAIKRKIADLKKQDDEAFLLVELANFFNRGRRKRDLENIQSQLANAQRELETFNVAFEELDRAYEEHNAASSEKGELNNGISIKQQAINRSNAEVAHLTSAREKILSKVAILERNRQKDDVESS